MSEQEQCIAIAEFCGYIWYRLPKDRLYPDREYRFLAHPSIHEYPDQSPIWMVRADGSEKMCNWTYIEKEGQVPNYVHDLNAMRGAASLLDPTQQKDFAERLHKLFAGQWHYSYENFDVIQTSAAQRAEGLLRTIGKWKE